MSHTNKTPNYDLPQFIGTDKASWLGDLNPAFLAIDAGMQANKVAAQAAEVSAGEASALAQSANSVANSAINSVANALSEIDNWIEININNPDTTNFVQYNCSLQFNPDLGIASLYNFIEFKDGFTPVLGKSGTPFIILPNQYFNNTYESTLYFSGNVSASDSEGNTIYYTHPQYIISGGKIYLKTLGGPVPSGGKYRFSTLSRMYYIKKWLK
ncbi:MAG: hypothetical protein [Bacteriophage sp.]|nr:MAG: hypothetical protein [Bacteriophage sp.]